MMVLAVLKGLSTAVTLMILPFRVCLFDNQVFVKWQLFYKTNKGFQSLFLLKPVTGDTGHGCDTVLIMCYCCKIASISKHSSASIILRAIAEEQYGSDC